MIGKSFGDDTTEKIILIALFLTEIQLSKVVESRECGVGGGCETRALSCTLPSGHTLCMHKLQALISQLGKELSKSC